MTFGLEGKVAIVTGPGGFAAGYSLALAEAGADVIVADLEESGTETVSALRSAGHEPLFVATDVTSESSARSMASAIASAFGGADVLVNNAALWQGLPHPPPEPLEQLPLELWQRLLEANLTSVLIVTRAVIPLMRSRGGGVIVNQTSPAVWQNSPGRLHYAVSKGGLLPMTRTMARELASENIRVNAIAPGPVTTGDPSALPKDLVARLTERMCIKRIGTPEDLVGTLLFLAGEMSSWITGQVLVVDGGGFMPT